MVFEKATAKLVYKDRVESGRKFINDIRVRGLFTAVTGVLTRFGENNRKLTKNLIGIPR